MYNDMKNGYPMKVIQLILESIYLSQLLLFICCLNFAYANDYLVDVKRSEQNLYKIIGKNIFIKTNHCYEYTYGEKAILRSNGYNGELIFIDNIYNHEKTRCNVQGVYGKVDIDDGSYRIIVSREDDNLYTSYNFDGLIKTDMCLSLALGEEATLVMKSNVGFLYIGIEGCIVEGIYKKIKLN